MTFPSDEATRAISEDRNRYGSIANIAQELDDNCKMDVQYSVEHESCEAA